MKFFGHRDSLFYENPCGQGICNVSFNDYQSNQAFSLLMLIKT